jgi:predicted alpha/beta superfamily hydrolase
MGYVHILRDFDSPTEGSPRTVRVYLPDAYEHEPGRRFPVLYMQDGQNVFNHPESARYDTWRANDAIERVAAEGKCEPWIIVAVDHGPDRFAEYSPWDEPRVGVKARGPLYVSFLADQLKPWVDRQYRTKPHPRDTAIMGSSLGGLISLYAGWSRPATFGRIGGVSPSVMWSLGRLSENWRNHPRQWQRIYLDVGTNEGIRQGHVLLDYPEAVRRFYEHLKGVGYEDWELRLVVEEGAGHHETDWQRRLPETMAWLLGTW